MTGRSRGSGRASVLALAGQRVSVVTCYTQESDAEQLSQKIALEVSRTPGNHRQNLLRGSEREFVITTDWATREAFHAFERSREQDTLTAPLRAPHESVNMVEESFRTWHEGPEHAGTTTPMRPFWAGRSGLLVLNAAATVPEVVER